MEINIHMTAADGGQIQGFPIKTWEPIKDPSATPSASTQPKLNTRCCPNKFKPKNPAGVLQQTHGILAI
jgi:hypothetical protein